MKKVLDFITKYKSIILSGIIGALVFIYIYGIEILDFTNIDWLVSNGGDLNQHYLGWEFFRRSPWTFPIGMNSIINYPYSISVIFTDSIPLFAVFFKIFSNILPEYFNYFGLYGILCFILQGIMASLILRKFIKNDYLVILFSIFFIISPVMIHRMYYHTSLASHYLILLGLVLILYKDKFNLIKTIILWSLLGFLSASTHMYFLVFSGIAVIGYMVYELLTTHNFKKIILSFVSYILIAFITVWALGGFLSPVTLFGRETIGTFNFNLNGYFNAFDEFSMVLDKLPLADGLLQEEGFAYLGLGIIISLFISILSLIVYVIYKLIKKEKLNINIKLGIVFVILLLISLLAASAHRIYLGKNLLFEIKFPEWLWKLVGVFRSNGRFSWTGFYVLMIGSFYLLFKCVKKELLIYLVVILFGIQVFDISGAIKHKTIKGDFYNIEYTLTDERWDLLFQEDFKNIVFTSEFSGNSRNDMYNAYLLAMKYNKTVNRFYIAQGILYDITEKQVVESTTNPSENDIFLIDAGSFLKYKDMNLNYYKLDNLYVATHLELGYLDKISSNELDIVVSNYMDIKLKENTKYHVVITGIDDINKDNINLRNIDFEIINNTISLVVHDVEINLENFQGKRVRLQIREIGPSETNIGETYQVYE